MGLIFKICRNNCSILESLIRLKNLPKRFEKSEEYLQTVANSSDATRPVIACQLFLTELIKVWGRKKEGLNNPSRILKLFALFVLRAHSIVHRSADSLDRFVRYYR